MRIKFVTRFENDLGATVYYNIVVYITDAAGGGYFCRSSGVKTLTKHVGGYYYYKHFYCYNSQLLQF